MEFLFINKRLYSRVLFQCFYYVVETLTFSCFELGFCLTAALFLQPIVFEVTFRLFKTKAAVWVTNLFFLIGINYIKKVDYFEGNEGRFLLWILSTCWINLKCLSCCVDKVDVEQKSDVLVELAYFFYFPTFFVGPFVNFADFQMILGKVGDFRPRFLMLLRNLIRFSFWLLFIEVSLNFCYVNAYGYQYEVRY